MKEEPKTSKAEDPTIPTWEAIWLLLKQCRVGMNITDIDATLRRGGLRTNRMHVEGVLATMEAFGMIDLIPMGTMKVATLNGKDIQEMEQFISTFRRETRQVKHNRKKGVIDPVELRKALTYSIGRCQDCGFPLIHIEGHLKCSGCGATPGEGFQPE